MNPDKSLWEKGDFTEIAAFIQLRQIQVGQIMPIDFACPRFRPDAPSLEER